MQLFVFDKNTWNHVQKRIKDKNSANLKKNVTLKYFYGYYQTFRNELNFQRERFGLFNGISTPYGLFKIH